MLSEDDDGGQEMAEEELWSAHVVSLKAVTYTKPGDGVTQRR